MMKTLLSLIAISQLSSAGLTIDSQCNVNSFSSYIKYINKNILVDNIDKGPTSGSDDLHFAGPNSNNHYRIFIDSTGDKSLPNVNNPKDYLIGKGKRGTWYNHLIQGLSIETTKYASTRMEFLDKYRAITFSYSYKYNFWNSWYAWTYKYDKNSPHIAGVKVFPLTWENKKTTIFEVSDSGHSNNESAKLAIEQKWNGNTITFNFYLSVSYNWVDGSTVHHASLAEFTNDEYTLTAAPIDDGNHENDPVTVENLEQNSNFNLGFQAAQISLNDIDNKLKEKAKDKKIQNAWFKTSNILVQSYTGAREVGKTTYVYSLIIRWDPKSFIVRDSTFLLNEINLTRILSSSGLVNEKYNFQYENSLNDKEETPQKNLANEYIGIDLKGKIYNPFIYI